MSKTRMIVHDDQLLIDMEVIFSAIREANGDWKKVEKEMGEYLAAMQEMLGVEGE